MANIDKNTAEWLEKIPDSDWLLVALAALISREKRAQLPTNSKIARMERKLSAYAEKLEKKYQS